MPLSARRLVELIRPAVRLVWIASPRETIYLVVSQAITGLVLPAQVFAGKWALDSIMDANRTGGGLQDALPAVVIALTAMTAGQCLATSSRHRSRLLPELAGRASQEMLAKTAATLDLQALETPAFTTASSARSTTRRFARRTWSATWRASSARRSRCWGSRRCCSRHPLLVLGLLATMLPLAWSNMTGGRDYYRNAVRRTPRRRVISYLQFLLTMLDSAKETRAFGLGPYLLARHGELYDEELDEFRRVVSQRQRREVLATLQARSSTQPASCSSCGCTSRSTSRFPRRSPHPARCCCCCRGSGTSSRRSGSCTRTRFSSRTCGPFSRSSRRRARRSRRSRCHRRSRPCASRI